MIADELEKLARLKEAGHLTEEEFAARKAKLLNVADQPDKPPTLFAAPEVGGRGSGGNVGAALASFIIPGLGQLLQGRLLDGIIHFVAAVVLWFVLLGWIVNILSAVGAARWKDEPSPLMQAFGSLMNLKCQHCQRPVPLAAKSCPHCRALLE